MTDKPALKIVQNKRFSPTQLTVEWNGQLSKHCILSLRAGQATISEALQTPALWGMIQANQVTALRPGDTVTVISPDGLVRADSAMVTAGGSEVYFSKPLRLVEMQPVALFETVSHRVIPEGSRFAIQSKKDGTVDRTKLYQTVEAAKHELLARQPVAV